jgi:hypothetical protein
MIPAASSGVPILATDVQEDDVSLLRLHVLRATYLLLVVGIGAMIIPTLISHPESTRGVIPSLIGGVWLLAFLGLRYPLRMVPLLMFEFAWKSLWLLVYGLPQWSTGQAAPTFGEDFPNILFGVILMPIVIPWTHVWRRYVKAPAERWR